MRLSPKVVRNPQNMWQMAISSVIDNQRKETPGRSRYLVWFLGLSVAMNAGCLVWQQMFDGAMPSPLTAFESQHVVDTDGDGVPDHRDLCPRSAKGFKSGRATDFDSDGCADDTEDRDIDNDGILDVHDKCPKTPQKYTFVSNAARDFDSDGCADGVEDSDDDNDMIPNAIDGCPLTATGDLSDKEGCSGLQREIRAHGVQTPAKGSPPARGKAPEDKQEKEQSKLEEWINLIIGCTLQMILGDILSRTAEKAEECYTSVKDQIPEAPGDVIRNMSADSIRRISSAAPLQSSWGSFMKKNGIRLMCYLLVFLYLQAYKCELASTSSWFAAALQAVGGSCPVLEAEALG